MIDEACRGLSNTCLGFFYVSQGLANFCSNLLSLAGIFQGLSEACQGFYQVHLRHYLNYKSISKLEFDKLFNTFIPMQMLKIWYYFNGLLSSKQLKYIKDQGNETLSQQSTPFN